MSAALKKAMKEKEMQEAKNNKAKELNDALKNKEEIEKMMSEMGFENFSDEMYNQIMRK
jgi:hypothetical protein